MDKAQWQELLSNWIDGSLTEEDKSLFEHYISIDPHRKKEAQDLKNLVFLLQDTPEIDVPESFGAAVISQIETDASNHQPFRQSVRTNKTIPHSYNVMALAATVLLVFVSLSTILPRVLPGMKQWFPGMARTQIETDGDQAGTTSGDGLNPDNSYLGSEHDFKKSIHYIDYDDFSEIGFSKMQSFPRLGVNQPAQEIIVSALAQKVEIPYFWGSFQVVDLEAAQNETETLIQNLGARIEQMEIIRVDKESVRLNYTVYIPAAEFDQVVESLIAMNDPYEVEELTLDRSAEYAMVSEMIKQEQAGIQRIEAEMKAETDTQEWEQLAVELEIRRASLDLLQRTQIIQTQGIIEYSLIREE